MSISSPRLRRLDAALANLPADGEAMLLSELDGYLAGVIACPEPIHPDAWLPPIWGEAGDVSPFEDDREAQWYAELVLAHHDAIAAALARGANAYRPFLEVDVRHGKTLWELWIEGFAIAIDRWPERWTTYAESDVDAVVEAFSGLTTLVEIARDESSLDRATIDALTEAAPGLIPQWVTALAAQRRTAPVPGPAAAKPIKIGRNDLCSCGSGKKHKKCCG